MKHQSTKFINLGSCCFRQPKAESHCKYLHGYDLNVKLWFTGKLDDNNWIVDFGGLKDLKTTFKDWFDHKTVIAKSDPDIKIFKRLDELNIIQLRIVPAVGMEMFSKLCLSITNTFLKTRDINAKCIRTQQKQCNLQIRR